jgi:zinc transport system substrate-binding protein
MRRRHLAPLALVGVFGSVVLFTGCPRGSSEDPWAAVGSKPKVLVSFAPLYSFASAVAGPDAEVKCLMTTTGPHTEGDATPHQMALARGCDVFVINGLGMEDGPDGFAPKLERTAGNPKWNVLNLGSKLDKEWLLEGEDEHEHHHGHDHGKAAEGHDHPTDPHAWLSIRCAKRMVESIRDELARLDPDHAAGYRERAAAYMAKLDKLEADGKMMLAKKTEKRVLSFHESLNYFAKTYGLEVVGSIEVDPGTEPSPDKLRQIIQKCQEPKPPVRVIAVEPQFPNNSSARVIRDALRGLKDNPIDAEFAEVDPLETCDEGELSTDLYEKVMRKNLAELTRVLR